MGYACEEAEFLFLSGHSASYGRKCVRVYLCEGDLRRLDRMCEKRKMARGDLVRERLPNALARKLLDISEARWINQNDGK